MAVFLIATVLVFLSKKSLKTKLLTTILPFVFYLPATYLFLLAYNYTTPKTFLIPANYQGALRIVYEQKCGTSYKSENGRRVLTFPDNGILILNEKFDGGVNNKYYLFDKNDARIMVREYFGVQKAIKKTPCILIGGGGTLGAGGADEIKFSDFYLYNKDTTLKDDYKLTQHFDSLTWKTVNDCRARK